MGLAMQANQQEKKSGLMDKKGVFSRFLVIKVLESLWLGNDIHFVSSKGFKQLSSEDKAFAKLLYITTLRFMGQIDALIDSLVLKALDKKYKNVRDVLRLGVVQHHYLKTPSHAIIATSLDLLDYIKQPHFKGFVHAVLSKIVKNTHAFILKDTGIDKNFPHWMFARWRAQYGLGQAHEIAHALSKEAPTDFSVKEDVSYWCDTLKGQLLPFDTIRIKNASPIETLEGYNTGDWWVQDWSSALPVKLLNAQKGKKALDLCAAPGGKTAQLLSLGLEVTSLDISEERLKKLRTNLKRLKLSSHIIQADASTWKSTEKFDYVLVDAPCSGTGTYRRHPERKFLRKENDLEPLLELQGKILRNGMEQLAKDGVLLYCTCSLEKEENEQQIDQFLGVNTSIERMVFTPEDVKGHPFLLTPKGDIQIFPYELQEFGGTDGFFIARLRHK